MDFKKKFTLEQRISESSRIIHKYPDRIPIICQHSPSDTKLKDIDKTKYLVPSDLTMGQFAYVIRKRMKINQEQAMFLVLDNNTLSPVSSLMSEIYSNYKNEDGFVYIYYMGENTFG